MLTRLQHLIESLAMYISLSLLGAICLLWCAIALPLLVILPRRAGTVCGQAGIMVSFRLYVVSLRLMGAYRLDVSALQELRSGPPVVLAPNHPSLIDALLIVAHLPNVACVMKSELMRNPFLSTGARLARYIRNDPPRHMIHQAVAQLREGSIVLLFPEGTRTTQVPISPLSSSVGIIAKYAAAPVQTLIIEQNSAFLSKGWSLFTRPTLPIRYRIRLGQRFDPPTNVRAFTAELEAYFHHELRDAAQNRWIEARCGVKSSG